MSFTLLFIAYVFVTACVRLNPEILQAGGNDYNIAMQSTRDEQMLLNLVRLKYRDTPFFLEVGSVSSQFRLSSEAAISANLNSRPISDTVGLNSKLNFVEQPTVTYAPLHGDDFVQRLLTPVSLDTILLLSNSGWSSERIFRLCIQNINGIPNAPTASGPTPAKAPEYKLFMELVGHLKHMQKNKYTRLGYIQTNDSTIRTLQFTQASQADPIVIRFKQVLGLDENISEFKLIEGQASQNQPDTITLTTRSLLGILFYLSHSVIVPEQDKRNGVVTTTYDESGQEFEWTELTKGLFTIHSSEQLSNISSVSTNYRGNWFYIADADLDSKSTFSLLIQLFSLQAGKAEGVMPVLTLPIGQ